MFFDESIDGLEIASNYAYVWKSINFQENIRPKVWAHAVVGTISGNMIIINCTDCGGIHLPNIFTSFYKQI